MRVLVLNPGSSSLKSSMIETASIPVAGVDGIVPAASEESLAPFYTGRDFSRVGL